MELVDVVEEICNREKYHFKLTTIVKRYCPCLDDERDELTKKVRFNGTRKLLNEMDVTRILRKIRNYESAFGYLLTERQKFLLKFNDRHVIDSDSDLISLDSAQSLFSMEDDPDLTAEYKANLLRSKVMLRLIDTNDLRNEDCGLVHVNRDLERGVGRQRKGNDTEQDEKESSILSESVIDSDRLNNDVRQHADDSELAPEFIGAAEPTPPSMDLNDLDDSTS